MAQKLIDNAMSMGYYKLGVNTPPPEDCNLYLVEHLFLPNTRDYYAIPKWIIQKHKNHENFLYTFVDVTSGNRSIVTNSTLIEILTGEEL